MQTWEDSVGLSDSSKQNKKNYFKKQIRVIFQGKPETQNMTKK